MRRLKKVIIFALFVLILVPTTSVQAASKGLEKKSVEIGVKDKVVISSKNYGDVKSWSISGGSAKIVSKNSYSATVKGIKNGKSTLKAKIGSKTYKCTITVKGATDSNSLKKKVKITSVKSVDGTKVLLKMRNTSDYVLAISGKVVFYNSNGNIVDTSSFRANPMDRNRIITDYAYCSKDYSYYEVLLESADKAWLKSYSNKITISTNKSDDTVYVTATNNSKKNLASKVKVAVIVYDVDGNFLDYDWTYIDCCDAGSSAIGSCWFYQYKDYIASYDTNIISAYTYK